MRVDVVTPTWYPTSRAIVQLVVLVTAAVAWSLAIGGGFQGWDDLHYLKAAEKWVAHGPSLPIDHWETKLPYVLVLALGIQSFGTDLISLIIPNGALFVCTIALCWFLSWLCFGTRGALISALVASSTPLFFRSPKTFYPEALEVPLVATAFILALISMWFTCTPKQRMWLLLIAGVFGGTAMSVRATSVVVPIALTVLMFYSNWPSFSKASRDVALLAIGHVIPILAEISFYYLMTGNPLYRYQIDAQSIVAGEQQVGQAVLGAGALLNWKLAEAWTAWAPAVVRVHWTINPLINLFLTPGLLLTPWFGLFGLFNAWVSPRARSIAILLLALLSAQLILFTFVLILSPSPRYYLPSVFLFCVLAGVLARLPSLFLTVVVGIQILLGLAIGLAQISPANVVSALKEHAKNRSPVYVSEQVRDAAYLAISAGEISPDNIRTGMPPAGGVALFGWDGFPVAELMATCQGTAKWQILDTRPNPSLPWRVILATGMEGITPARIANYLRRDVETAILAQRNC